SRPTPSEPRCVKLTASPSPVWIVSVRPFVGTEPAKLTTPAAGASTGAPASAPIAMPRCCPAAYGCAGSNENVSSTGPLTGHVHAPAHRTKKRNRSTIGPNRPARRIAHHHLVVEIENRTGTVAAAAAVVHCVYTATAQTPV